MDRKQRAAARYAFADLLRQVVLGPTSEPEKVATIDHEPDAVVVGYAKLIADEHPRSVEVIHHLKYYSASCVQCFGRDGDGDVSRHLAVWREAVDFYHGICQPIDAVN